MIDNDGGDRSTEMTNGEVIVVNVGPPRARPSETFVFSMSPLVQKIFVYICISIAFTFCNGRHLFHQMRMLKNDENDGQSYWLMVMVINLERR